MSIIDTAKELLQKGITLNDQELIEMANQLLDSAAVPPLTAASRAEASTPRPNPGSPDAGVEVSDFLSKTKNDLNTFRKGIPVNEVTDRVNSFVDTGEEQKDINTPEVSPTQRRDAPRKYEQVCQECSSVVAVLEVHKREHFVCDGCLSKRKR